MSVKLVVTARCSSLCVDIYTAVGNLSKTSVRSIRGVFVEYGLL